MKKSTFTSLILTAAAAAGGVLYLFYTERGIRLRKRVVKDVTNTVDEWLENLETVLEEAEEKARKADDE